MKNFSENECICKKRPFRILCKIKYRKIFNTVSTMATFSKKLPKSEILGNVFAKNIKIFNFAGFHVP